MQSDILKPVVVLALWSLIMLVWAVATRLPAMKAAGIDLAKLRGGTGKDADGVLPASAQWKAHNYNHLMEQPTLFYAVALVVALVGAGNGLNAWIAWGYVGLRVVHSLIQATHNRVQYRFLAFGASTLCLTALTIQAAIAVFG